MKMRPANLYQRRAVKRASELLRDALIMARTANCPRLTKRIRLAIASAGGAARHMERRVFGVLHVMRADRSAFANVESHRTYLNARRQPETPGAYRWQRIHQ